jgi:hypothetical protein
VTWDEKREALLAAILAQPDPLIVRMLLEDAYLFGVSSTRTKP